MSRSPTRAFESNEQPTSPLPNVTLFDLLTETRRMDAAKHAFDAERTVSIGPEENARLLASALAHTDDAPTRMAPSPVTSLGLSLELSTELAPRPPFAVTVSGICPRIRPEIVRTAGNDRGSAWLPKGKTETCLVAGIWVMALSLFALLTLLATAA